MNEKRFVFDTNVLVSALLLPKSTPRRAVDFARSNGRLLISVTTLQELSDVLGRPKFAKYVSEEDRRLFLAALVQEAEIVDVVESISECRDHKDDKFLEAAWNGRADCIITGDEDLLVLHPFRGITIIKPADLLSLPFAPHPDSDTF